MIAIEYTTSLGMVDFELPEEDDQAKGEAFEDWLIRAGFESYPHRTGLESEYEHGNEINIYTAANGECKWAAVVHVSTGDRYDLIFVRTRSALIRLRIELAPLSKVDAMRRFDALVSMAEKAFHAFHGHGADEDCAACNPSGVYHAERMAKIAQEKKKEAAINPQKA